MNVSAKDKATDKEQKITITSSSGLSKEEVEKMVQEAKAHEAEDKKTREAIEKKNRLDGLILDIEKTLKENKEKLSEDDIKKTEDALATARTALTEHAQDPEALQKATDDLIQASHKVAELLYKQAQEKTESNSSETAQEEKEQGPIDTEIS